MTDALVAVGAPAAPLTRTITQADMVAYAGATWDWHRMHYDPSYYQAKGFPAAVVDGQLLGALLAEMLQDWLGPRAVLRSLQFRFKNLVFAGETVRCHGQVSAVVPDPDGDGELVTLDCAVDVLDASGGVARPAISSAGATVVVRR